MAGSAGKKPKQVALVIGSGSVKCAASLGVMKVLEREGIGVDLIVGCSGGSLYAVALALGFDVPTIQDMTIKLWTREITGLRKRKSFFQILFPKLFGFDETFGLVDDRLVMDRLSNAFGAATFADAKIPLFISATNFLNGEQVILQKGSVVDAIRASIAIPYIFEPYRVDGKLLVDGYLSDPMPVGIAMREGANVIVAVGFDSPYQSRINSLPRFSFQISSIMANNLFKANFAFHNLAHHSEVFPVMPNFEERICLFDTEKIPYIIVEGERSAEEQLPYIRRFLSL